MFFYIVIAFLVIYWIRKSTRKSRAERRMKEYPNAMKRTFGYYNNISLDDNQTIKLIVDKSEEYWKDTEKEETERVNRCNNLKSNYPNGWESWKQLGHQKNYEDLLLVERDSERIKDLESVFSDYREYENWKKSQDLFVERAISYSGYSLQFDVKVPDRYGTSCITSFNVAHLFTKKDSCKSESLDVPYNLSNFVDSIINCARNIDDEIVFLLTNDCSNYKPLFDSLGICAINIADINHYSWNGPLKFAVLTKSANEQQVKFMCEILFSEIQQHSLVVVFSLVKTVTDTEYNVNNYKPYSPTHNIENSYELDSTIEKHQYGEAYYYTIKNQTCKTVKKAISACFEKFDTDTVAKHTYKKHKWDDSSPYYRKSIEEIKAMWAEKREVSARSNRKLRDDIMKILSKQSYEKDESTNLFELFNSVWKISPYRTNWHIFDSETGIVASVDCLAFMEGKFILFSWIRSDSAIEIPTFNKDRKTLKYVISDQAKPYYVKEYYNYGLKQSVFSGLHDCQFTKYSIEQEVIKYILKKNYGINVEENYIVILHPKFKVPVAFNGDDVSYEVKYFMIKEAERNNKKPTIESEYGMDSTVEVCKEDLESIELVELF